MIVWGARPFTERETWGWYPRLAAKLGEAFENRATKVYSLIPSVPLKCDLVTMHPRHHPITPTDCSCHYH